MQPAVAMQWDLRLSSPLKASCFRFQGQNAQGLCSFPEPVQALWLSHIPHSGLCAGQAGLDVSMREGIPLQTLQGRWLRWGEQTARSITWVREKQQYQPSYLESLQNPSKKSHPEAPGDGAQTESTPLHNTGMGRKLRAEVRSSSSFKLSRC